MEIRHILLDDKNRKAYDLTLTGVSQENKYIPISRMERYRKEKDGERCHEEGIALLENCE